MATLIISALMLGFVAAQGGVVFLTAWLFRRSVRVTSWWSKPIFMMLAYCAWIMTTVFGYFLMGGEGGLMDGFGMVLGLCFSALISSIAYGLAWLVYPLALRSVRVDCG